MQLKNSVPVLYYHRVGTPDPAHLSVSVEEFDQQMNFLARRGYNVIGAETLYKWVRKEVVIRFPAVCITFDDGFIDNLVCAHPILQKYGFKAALFVATSLIRPELQKPASVHTDFNNAHTLARRGDFSHFLSASELYFMKNTSAWEIYPHSHRHDQIFISSEQTGVFPDTDNHWGILSAWDNPLSENAWPVYKRGAALVNCGYKANLLPGDIDYSCPAISHAGVVLHKETFAHYERRVKEDLQISLGIVQKMFPDNLPLMCWPWGRATPELERLASESGYLGAFRTDTGANIPGINPFYLRRFPVKKRGLARFALGLLLRSNSQLAHLYAMLRN